MSYKYRRLMLRRLELYHDLLTEQLRPIIEDAAAATDNPKSDHTDSTDDTDDDSDEDLCEWEHPEDKSSEESCARVAEWRCEVERYGIWDGDTPDHRPNPDEGSVRGEAEQNQDGAAAPSAEVRSVEHVGDDRDADPSGKSSRGFSVLIWDGPGSNTNNRSGESGEADVGDDTSDGSVTSITVLPDPTETVSELSTDDASEDLTTPPSSPWCEASITANSTTIDDNGHQAIVLGNITLADYSQLTPADFSFSKPLLSFGCGTPRIVLPAHCPPTPPPDTRSYFSTSSISSISSQPRFAVTPAELKFFNKHIEEVAYMIKCVEFQFKMQDYRQEIRKQDRYTRRDAELEEQMKIFQWSHGVPSQWDSVGGVGEGEMAGETGHQAFDTSGELAPSGLEDEPSPGTNFEDVEIPNSSELIELKMDCGTQENDADLDSVVPEDVNEGDTTEEDWYWSFKLAELREKIHPHQPVRPSPLRKGYTPDDMVWEENVEEAEYLSFYGHQSKKDRHGRRYWRL